MNRALLSVAFSILIISARGVAQTSTETVLYSFCGATPCGSHPAGLIQGFDENFYGITGDTIFRLTPAGKLTTLYEFAGNDEDLLPSSLILGGDGNYYGVTETGGNETNCPDSGGCGTIFSITPQGKLTTLYEFCNSSDVVNDCPDGSEPTAPLVQGSDGNFYGTTGVGGNSSDCSGQGCGTIFRITSSGVLTTLYSFTGGTDGGGPLYASLVQASDGNFYGGAALGGSGRNGTIFRISSSGELNVVFSFPENGSDGTAYSGIFTFVEQSDGSLYGVTPAGGNEPDCPSEYQFGCGAIFKFTPSGGFTLLYAFSGTADGSQPSAGLLLASDGNFYGVAGHGGTQSPCPTSNGFSGCGTLYQISASGSFTRLYIFQGSPDASLPLSLTQSNTGVFYGASISGGDVDESEGGDGTIFKASLSPTLAAPILLTAPSTVNVGESADISFESLNSFSTTMQQCYAFATNQTTGIVYVLGRAIGTLSSNIYSGSLSATPTAAGTYLIAVTCGGVESGFATMTVLGAPTTTILADSGSPILSGATETLTITIAPVQQSSIAPTGTVSLLYKGSVVDTATLSGGVGTLKVATTNFAAESYTVTASYSGDSNYAASTSNAVTVVVQPDATTTTLSASPNPVTEGNACVLTAKVTTTAGTPAGYVDFLYGSDVLGSADLVNGTATLSESSARVVHGTYGITARYSGDDAHSASTSNAVNVIVQ